jgi:peptidoglycan/LPS O-acetylase OafA/YrhL
VLRSEKPAFPEAGSTRSDPVAAAPRESARFLSGRPLAEALIGHDNAFGFLRLVLASLVIVDHAFPLGGFGADPMWAWSSGQDSFGGIAVGGFFIISGYLITKSALGTDWIQYLWRRGLRILPAYWMVLLVGALIVGPLAWYGDHHTLAGFWAPSDHGPKAYLVENFFLEIKRYGMHDLFLANTPYGAQVKGSVFNGSLWSLIYEWRCYILILALAVAGILRGARPVVIALGAALYLLVCLQTADVVKPGHVVAWLTDVLTARYTMLFVLGGLAALYAKKIPVDDRLGIASCLLVVFCLHNGGYVAIGYPAMVYAFLWLAVRLPAGLRAIGARNDYSYGVYLYGFLVQQSLARIRVHHLGIVPFIMASFLLTYACAYLSWHLIEKPAMKLKDWGPGKGFGYLVGRGSAFLKALRPALTSAR